MNAFTDWANQLWKQLDQLLSLPSAPPPAATPRRIFYHGTQTPIHTLKDHYLDPRFASGGDEGDPKKPHVFVTPDKLMAKIFALKAPDVVGINVTKSGPNMILSEEPKNIKGGWIYECVENPQQPFEELVVRGWNTNKWVSFEKTAITKPEYIPGLDHLIENDKLQVYVLKKGTDVKAWNEAQRNAAYDGGLETFYAEQLRSGQMSDYNARKCAKGLTMSTETAQKNWGVSIRKEESNATSYRRT